MAGSSGADDPDWLRAFQAPSMEPVTLSSDSDMSPKLGNYSAKEEKADTEKEECGLAAVGVDFPELKSEPSAAKKETLEELTEEAMEEEWPVDEDAGAKAAISQRLPLIVPDKVQRSKALVECDGDSVDLSGDIGAVGRIIISDGPAGNNELLLDLKGTIYKSTIVPSRTFCIVSVGQSEAKVEAIMNDFIQLEPQSNFFEAETMVEGTLDDFLFDSDEEADKISLPSGRPTDQHNENEEQTNMKTKRKAKADKTGGAAKKAKIAVRPPKKGHKKTTAARKSRPAKR